MIRSTKANSSFLGGGEREWGWLDTYLRTVLFVVLIFHYFALKYVFFVVVNQLVGTLILSRYERCQERISMSFFFTTIILLFIED